MRAAIIFLTATALLPAASHAGEVYRVGQTKDVMYFIDVDNIKPPVNGKVRAWVTAIHENFPAPNADVYKIVQLNSFNCASETSSSLSYVAYNKSGDVLANNTDPLPKETFIIPGTGWESVYNFVCKIDDDFEYTVVPDDMEIEEYTKAIRAIK